MLDTNFMYKLGRQFALAANGGRLAALPYGMYNPTVGSPGSLLGYPIHPGLLHSHGLLRGNQNGFSVDTLFGRHASMRQDGAMSPDACSDKQGLYCTCICHMIRYISIII